MCQNAVSCGNGIIIPLIADCCFDDGYVGKQRDAWK